VTPFMGTPAPARPPGFRLRNGLLVLWERRAVIGKGGERGKRRSVGGAVVVVVGGDGIFLPSKFPPPSLPGFFVLYYDRPLGHDRYAGDGFDKFVVLIWQPLVTLPSLQLRVCIYIFILEYNLCTDFDTRGALLKGPQWGSPADKETLIYVTRQERMDPPSCDPAIIVGCSL
jgi:hypothetical protein